MEWELFGSEGASKVQGKSPVREIKLVAEVNPQDFLLPGWKLVSNEPLPTFTTSRPRASPGYKPAGLQQCTYEERARWVQDQHRFPPYQYCENTVLLINGVNFGCQALKSAK